MSKYTFILRKNQIEIELSSTDPAFLTKQMKIWQAALVPDIHQNIEKTDTKTISKHDVQYFDDSTDTKIYESLKESEKVLKEYEVNQQEKILPDELNQQLSEVLQNNDLQEIETHPNIEEHKTNNVDEIVSQSSSLLSAFEYDTTQEDSVEEIEKNLKDLFPEENTLQEPDSNELSVEQLSTNVELIDQEELISYDPVETAEFIDSSTLLDEPVNPALTIDVVEEAPEPDLSEINDLMSEFDTADTLEESVDSLDITVSQPDKIELSDFVSEEEELVIDNSVASNIELPTEEDEDSVLSVDSAQVDSPDEDLDSVLSEMLSEMEDTELPMGENNSDQEILLDTSMEDDLLDALAEEPVPEKIPDVMPEVIVKPVEQPKLVSYETYITSVSLKVPIDLLIATAHYICKFESKTKFTTKDISAKTMETFKRPVSPNTVLAAVNKGYIEVIPDFTGTAESNEYIITESGYSYITSNLAYEQE